MNSFLLSILLLFLISCSKSEPAKVSVNFQSVFALKASGGLMVWGKNLKTNRSFGLVVSGNQIDLPLPEGIWKFYAIGWKGETPLSGDTICDQTEDTKITAIGKNKVSLSLTRDNCKNLPFLIANDPKAKACPSLENCEEIATVRSYKVLIQEFDNIQDGLPIRKSGLESACQEISHSEKSEFNLLRVPFGNNDTAKLFGIKIQFFRNTNNCSLQNDLSETFHFHGGLSKPISENTTKLEDDVIKFEIPADPCLENGDNFFAGGDGETDPFLICNANQLLNVVDQYLVNPSSSYKLLRDIDLSGFIKTHPSRKSHAWDKCMGADDTFLPIGFNKDCNSTSTFQGTFDGNQKSIIGLKMNHPGNSNIGFFRQTKNAIIQDLTLINPQILSQSTNGAIAGISTSSNFNNIVIEGLNLDSTLSSNTGGIIGVSFKDEISKILIDGSVSGITNVGGLIGIASGTNIELSRFQGHVLGTQVVGGIIGSVSQSGDGKQTKISKTYAYGNIQTSLVGANNRIHQGGILGQVQGDIPLKIEKNYFFGKLTHICSGVNCNIFNIGPGADATNFSLDAGTNATNTDKSLKISRNQILGNSDVLKQRLPSAEINLDYFYDDSSINPSQVSNHKLVNVDGDIPRFDFEIEPCSDDSGQRFAGGEGTLTNPYLICTAHQFLNIIDETLTNPSRSYKLIRNINLSGIDLGEIYPCAGGSTFIPIGYDSNCFFNQEFSGLIDGNSKSISGLKIDINKDDVAMISESSGSTVKNLKLINPEISGKSRVGTIAGSSTGSKFENIVIEKLKIGPKVNSSIIGGLVGQSSKDAISKTLIDGSINVDGANTVGGIVGYSSGSAITLSRFEGMVSGDYIVGGIAGKADINLGDSTISKNYVHGIIKSTYDPTLSTLVVNARNLGGIAGMTTAKVEFNYFFGKLIHSCSLTTETQCQIDRIASTANNTNFYPTIGDIKMNATNSDGSVSVNKTEFLGASPSLTISTADSGNKSLSVLSVHSLENVEGDIPRFDFESSLFYLFSMHPCRKFEAHKNFGNQVLTDQNGYYFICNRTQVQELQTLAANGEVNASFKLTNYIFLDELIAPTPGLKFSGVLDGAGRDLLGFTLNEEAEGKSWWNEVTDGIFLNFAEIRYKDGTTPGNPTDIIGTPSELPFGTPPPPN